MLVLAEILALILLNALVFKAFARWKIARRTSRSRRRTRTRTAAHYPHHPSPAIFQIDPAPEPTAFVRPAGLDW